MKYEVTMDIRKIYERFSTIVNEIFLHEQKTKQKQAVQDCSTKGETFFNIQKPSNGFILYSEYLLSRKQVNANNKVKRDNA